MAKQTNSMFDPTEPVPKIVQALHDAKIPIAALELVFEEVRKNKVADTVFQYKQGMGGHFVLFVTFEDADQMFDKYLKDIVTSVVLHFRSSIEEG